MIKSAASQLVTWLVAGRASTANIDAATEVDLGHYGAVEAGSEIRRPNVQSVVARIEWTFGAITRTRRRCTQSFVSQMLLGSPIQMATRSGYG